MWSLIEPKKPLNRTLTNILSKFFSRELLGKYTAKNPVPGKYVMNQTELYKCAYGKIFLFFQKVKYVLKYFFNGKWSSNQDDLLKRGIFLGSILIIIFKISTFSTSVFKIDNNFLISSFTTLMYFYKKICNILYYS